MKKLLITILMSIMLFIFADPAGCLIGYVNRQTLVVYDTVLPGDEVEIRALFDGQEKEYHIIINSKGGHAFTGLSIVNHIKDLKESGAKVTTEVSGTAMSAAAIIWLMGDVRIVHKNDIIMFHGAKMMNQYDQPVPEDQIDKGDKLVIDTINEAMYVELAKLMPEKEARKAIEDDLYVTGQQAFEMKLATTLK